MTIGRWLLVALAIVGLALAPGLVSAHGTDTTADDTHPYNGTTHGDETTADDTHPHNGATDDAVTWMEDRMTDHMGPEGIEWMESNTGVTVDGMAQDHADDHEDGEYGHVDDHEDGEYGHVDDHEDEGYGHADDHEGYGQGHC